MHPISAFVLGTAMLCVASPAQFVYGVDTSRNVYEFDHATGASALVGQLPSIVPTPRELAYDPQAERLYVLGHVSGGAPTFFAIDVTNWAVALTAALPAAVISYESVEWHGGYDRMFVLNSSGDLFKIVPSTGNTAFVGNTGFSGLQSLGYDSSTNTMYVCGGNPPMLYELDVNNAATTSIAPLSGSTNCAGMTYDADLQRMLISDSPFSKLRVLDLATGVATQLSTANTPNIRAIGFVPGSGTLVRDAITCSPASTAALGSPNLGGNVSFRIQGATGIPVVGYGLADVLAPFCGCTIGHDWLVTEVGAESVFQIPNNPAYVGALVIVQGLDFLGAGGCPDPQLAFTDRVKITIGN